MKKMNFILKLFVLAVIVVFSACSKDDKASPVTIDQSETATISGLVYAELNDTLDSKIDQFAPKGTVLLFTYSLSQFHSYLSTTSDQTVVDSTSVNSNGTYSITVPAIATGATVTLSTNDFTYMQKGRSTYTGNDTSIRKVYSLPSQTISGLVPGEVRVIDLTFTPSK
jgi:hypothetical protein